MFIRLFCPVVYDSVGRMLRTQQYAFVIQVPKTGMLIFQAVPVFRVERSALRQYLVEFGAGIDNMP